MKHHIERTSPKGGPFLGTCRLCRKENLKMMAVNEDCENVRGLTPEAALLESIDPSRGSGGNAKIYIIPEPER